MANKETFAPLTKNNFKYFEMDLGVDEPATLRSLSGADSWYLTQVHEKNPSDGVGWMVTLVALSLWDTLADKPVYNARSVDDCKVIKEWPLDTLTRVFDAATKLNNLKVGGGEATDEGPLASTE